MKRPGFYIMMSLIALAVLGLGYKLFTNPTGLLTSIVIGIVVFSIIFFLFKRAGSSPDQRSYNKAVKQSKKYRHQKGTGIPAKKTNVIHYLQAQTKQKPKKAKRKSDVHLTVIEGKKGKKKNRA